MADSRREHIVALAELIAELEPGPWDEDEISLLARAVTRESRWLARQFAAGRAECFEGLDVNLMELLKRASTKLMGLVVELQVDGMTAALDDSAIEYAHMQKEKAPMFNRNNEPQQQPTVHEELVALEAEAARLTAEYRAAVSAHWRLATAQTPGAKQRAYGDPSVQAEYSAEVAALQTAVDVADAAALKAKVALNEFRVKNAVALSGRDPNEGPLQRALREHNRQRLDTLKRDLEALGVTR